MSEKLVPWCAASLFLTMITWLEVAYGIVKSIFFLRSSVTVIPDIPISAFPEDTAVIIESNSISSTDSFIPRESAIALDISISIPLTLPLL